jgi:hypothetical protein
MTKAGSWINVSEITGYSSTANLTCVILQNIVITLKRVFFPVYVSYRIVCVLVHTQYVSYWYCVLTHL